MNINLPTIRCLRCNHGWVPRKSEVKICPKCKTRYWRKKRTYDIARKQKRLAKILFSCLDAADFLRGIRGESD